MDLMTRVKILDEAVYISDSTDTLRKVINTTTLPPVMGEY